MSVIFPCLLITGIHNRRPSYLDVLNYNWQAKDAIVFFWYCGPVCWQPLIPPLRMSERPFLSNLFRFGTCLLRKFSYKIILSFKYFMKLTWISLTVIRITKIWRFTDYNYISELIMNTFPPFMDLCSIGYSSIHVLLSSCHFSSWIYMYVTPCLMETQFHFVTVVIGQDLAEGCWVGHRLLQWCLLHSRSGKWTTV